MGGSGSASGHLTATTAAELRAALPGGGVLLGLDLGTRTIGTALSDAGAAHARIRRTTSSCRFRQNSGIS